MKILNLISKDKVLGLVLGQFLSILITSTGVCSQLLVSNYGVSIPTTQSCLNYLLISLYIFYNLYQKGSNYIAKETFKKRGFIYLLLSLVDVEANYFVVKAYHFTNITRYFSPY